MVSRTWRDALPRGAYGLAIASVSDVAALAFAQSYRALTDFARLEVVEAVLAAYRNGDPLNRIAKNVDHYHSAVKRIIDAAEAHGARPLATAG
jgi:hypothetical protein